MTTAKSTDANSDTYRVVIQDGEKLAVYQVFTWGEQEVSPQYVAAAMINKMKV